MALVKLKQKGQMTLPAEIRTALSLKEGDLLEINIENGKVSLSPKMVVDRRAEAFKRMEEIGDRVRERLAVEGKTEEDLEQMIENAVREVRAEKRAEQPS
jgi:AbrB family looped-hinge helix DNA binding protein